MTFGRYFSICAICLALGIFVGSYAYSPKEGYKLRIKNNDFFVVETNNGSRTPLIEQNDGYFVRLSEFNDNQEKEQKLEGLEKTLVRFDKAVITR